MEAGYDYLLLRGRLQRRFVKYAGILVLFLGAAMLATGGAYYGYAAKARADLDNLNVTLPGAIEDLGQPGGQPSLVPSEAAQRPQGNPAPAGEIAASADQGAAKLLPAMSAAAISSRELYPGEELEPASWSNPLAFEPAWYREQVLLQGFTLVESGQAPVGLVTAAATRLIVPSIGVDSSVAELAIRDLGGSRAYETPANTVGHIPETANAGELGSAWFFGHTESPILGEGSVFYDLRRIPGMLRNGEDVFIIADNGLEQYLYRAVSSEVVHQDDMRLYDTGHATIHLVSCVPRLVYDYRLIVTGELVAQKTLTRPPEALG